MRPAWRRRCDAMGVSVKTPASVALSGSTAGNWALSAECISESCALMRWGNVCDEKKPHVISKVTSINTSARAHEGLEREREQHLGQIINRPKSGGKCPSCTPHHLIPNRTIAVTSLRGVPTKHRKLVENILSTPPDAVMNISYFPMGSD